MQNYSQTASFVVDGETPNQKESMAFGHRVICEFSCWYISIHVSDFWPNFNFPLENLGALQN